MPLTEGNGLFWDDPREIHRVVVDFKAPIPSGLNLRLEYWGSRWPQQRLPKDREPGGGDVGWMELGNWYNGGWRIADSDVTRDRNRATFTFRPVSAREFPQIKDYPATFRYTLKVRLASDQRVPEIDRIRAYTDSILKKRTFRLAWRTTPGSGPRLMAFNGRIVAVESRDPQHQLVTVEATANPDPNTFDKTLVTVGAGKTEFTFALGDVAKGPLLVPDFNVAVLPGTDDRNFDAIVAAQKASGSKTLYEQVATRPEQTWAAAWKGIPPKKSHIYLPLGLDGGRERFMFEANGNLRLRSNDHYLLNRPGKDSPRLKLEPAPVAFEFGERSSLLARRLHEDRLPICESVWEGNGFQIRQTSFVTELNGSQPSGPVPPADAFAVFMAKATLVNTSSVPVRASVPLVYRAGENPRPLRCDEHGFLWGDDKLRGQVVGASSPRVEQDGLVWDCALAPGESKSVLYKLPYVVLSEPAEHDLLAALDFERELAGVAGYWRRRLDESARLVTPEPILNSFYASHARHLLVNCEREPLSTRRFARVGSFSYGAYGNESCMMVVDLERRGYHREAQECLDAWLHYQGTVKLPGDFASKEGILYGAGGYEAGGYNQHHGWILWALAEHYRFTRDDAWLRAAAPGILAGADWIIRETRRTASRQPLERGLLPAGSLEDIGDWWTWLSTSCYTWRGLDSAAWALERAKHHEAGRVRKEASLYHTNLLANFRAAARRSPVVRLRDGTAVPHFPSYVQRRGRSFGWICETLEGGLHLLITGALDARSREADWIINDYEDNLYLSNQYGYTLDDFDQNWFSRGGMSMQACLLLDAEPYLFRDDVKHALRAIFNAIAVSHFPDVHMNTEHALPAMDDWRGDHFKSSDEANACGWLRYLFLREQGDTLLVGQAVPEEWLRPGRTCGIERAATHFGQASVIYEARGGEILTHLAGPTRNPPAKILLRFRSPSGQPVEDLTVNGKKWKNFRGDWVELPGNIGKTEIVGKVRP
jgi:hypothetical protein